MLQKKGGQKSLPVEKKTSKKQTTNQKLPVLSEKWKKAFAPHNLTDDEFRWLAGIRKHRVKKIWNDVPQWVEMLLGRYRKCVSGEAGETVKEFEKRVQMGGKKFTQEAVSVPTTEDLGPD